MNLKKFEGVKQNETSDAENTSKNDETLRRF